MGQNSADKLRLLVVDDEPDNLDLLYRTFRRDFEVIQADSAIAALQILAEQGEMAIIISDQRMPEMLGTEFLSKTVERFPDTIRIVLTGYTDVGDLVEAINSGQVFKYITKPWNADQLHQVVAQAAETYRAVKHRTQTLRRSLRRESILNAVMTAIRESLDYQSMLQTIAETVGRTFEVSRCTLFPIEGNRASAELSLHPPVTAFSYQATSQATAPAAWPSEIPIQSVFQTPIPKPPIPTPDGQLMVPLTYQHDFLAILHLQRDNQQPWQTEDLELIQDVADQAALALSQAKLYRRTQEQAEQMRSELEVARQIQSNLLRQSLPELEGLRVQACCYPAREVGGDFFEVFAHPLGDIWLAVGDVSGKGVPAALFMASAISVLRRELSQESPPDPHHILHNLNRSLCDDLISTNCFITMVLARYTPANRKLVYANAGHIYPLVWSHQQLRDHGQSAIAPNYLKIRGVPLGILPTWNATAGKLNLNPGEILLLISDGITEATVIQQPVVTNHGHHPPARSMLQQTGLWHLILQAETPLCLTQLLDRIQADNPIQDDDQTLLALEVL